MKLIDYLFLKESLPWPLSHMIMDCIHATISAFLLDEFLVSENHACVTHP